MIHRAVVSALVLSVLAGCATAPPDGTVVIELSKDDVAACNDEGGCVVVTQKKLFTLKERAYRAGVEWATGRI